MPRIARRASSPRKRLASSTSRPRHARGHVVGGDARDTPATRCATTSADAPSAGVERRVGQRRRAGQIRRQRRAPPDRARAPCAPRAASHSAQLDRARSAQRVGAGLVGQAPDRDASCPRRRRAAASSRRCAHCAMRVVARPDRRRAGGVGTPCARAELRRGTRRRAPACRRRTRRPATDTPAARSALPSSGRARPPSASAPTCSQSAAISLMNVTDVARNALMRVLGHLGRLDRHPLDAVGEAARAAARARLASRVVAHADDDAVGLRERPRSPCRAAGSPASRRSDTRRPPACAREALLRGARVVPTGSCDETSTSAPSRRCGNSLPTRVDDVRRRRRGRRRPPACRRRPRRRRRRARPPAASVVKRRRPRASPARDELGEAGLEDRRLARRPAPRPSPDRSRARSRRGRPRPGRRR